jgi:glyoxylase-like metal-dependent hydrolase (beta-lactamase superfamily II)
MLRIQEFVFNPFQENTYILYDETREAAIVDPGCYEKAEQWELSEFILKNGLTVKMLLNTHCHIDHVLGNAFVKEKFKVALHLHRLDEPVLKAVSAYAPNYGFQQYQDATADKYLEEGDEIVIGRQKFQVLFVPGHSPGHVAFFHAEEKALIGGDVLFKSSVGRTDLPGGDTDTLIRSIRQKLFVLPDDTTVYPGHGPTTTIGEEKVSNPFCAITTN